MKVSNDRIIEGIVLFGAIQRNGSNTLIADFCDDSVFTHGYVLASTVTAHILNTPKRESGMGALRDADKASPSTRRVSAGSMTPSSQSRAEE